MIRNLRIAKAVALACVCIAAAAGAQTGADSTSTPPPATQPAPVAQPVPAPPPSAELASLLRGGAVGELMSLYVPRSEQEIQKLTDEARSLERAAASEIENGRLIATEADGRATIMGEEINVTKAKRDAAKKVKDKAAAAELDAALKKQEREKKYLDQLRDALRADTDRLESAGGAAGALAKALELELQVVRKQAALAVSTPPPPPPAIAEYRSLLRNMLQAQRDAANLGREASDKRKAVAEKRLKQLDALVKLGG